MFSPKPVNCTEKYKTIGIVFNKGYKVKLIREISVKRRISNLMGGTNENICQIVYFADGSNKHPRIYVNNPQHVIALSISDTEHRIIYHETDRLWVWNPKIIKNKPTFLCKIASEDISCIMPLDGTEKILVATTATATKMQSRKEFIINVHNKKQICLQGENSQVTSCFHCIEENSHRLITTNESGTMIVWDMNDRTRTDNIPAIIQNSPMTNIRLFASDMLVYNGDKFLVAVTENNDIVLLKRNKKYDPRWQCGDRSSLWIIDKSCRTEIHKVIFNSTGKKIGLILSVCVINGINGIYVVTGHKESIIIRYIENGSERIQRLKLDDNMAAVQLIPIPGTSDFYSILCPVESEQKDRTIFGFRLHKIDKNKPTCLLWNGPKSEANKESKGLNGTV